MRALYFRTCLKLPSLCLFSKGERLNKENYRPISILNTFSEVSEHCILEQLTPFFDKIITGCHCFDISQFWSAYWKNVNCQNVLLRLMEQWRSYLDNNKVVGAVLVLKRLMGRGGGGSF